MSLLVNYLAVCTHGGSRNQMKITMCAKLDQYITLLVDKITNAKTNISVVGIFH